MQIIKGVTKLTPPQLRGSLNNIKWPAFVETKFDGELNWLSEYLKGEELVDFARASGFKRLALILMKKPKLAKLARKLL